MNKRIMAAAFISLALMLTSCSSADKDNTPERVAGGQTKVSATQNSGDAKSPDPAPVKGFYITYNGVNVALDAETAPVVKAIGGNPVFTKDPSCAYVGSDYTYDYKAFVIFAQSRNGKELITTIEVRSDAVDVGGIKIGQTLADVKKLYGEPVSADEIAATYTKDGTQLQFITDESGKVVLITLSHETAE